MYLDWKGPEMTRIANLRESIIIWMTYSTLDSETVKTLLGITVEVCCGMGGPRVHTITDESTDSLAVFIYDSGYIPDSVIQQFEEDFDDCKTKADAVEQFESLGYQLEMLN